MSASAGERTEPAELIPPWPGDFAQTAGCRVFVRHAPPTGPGAEPAVFVHGLGGGSTSWTDLMELLRDRLDGYAPDMPGFGQSPPPPGMRYDLHAQVEATVGLVESAGHGSVHLFGNSLGGTVATRVAARRPDLVRTLTLISPAMPDLRPRLGPTQLLIPLVPRVGPALMRRNAENQTPEELARQNLEGLYGDPARLHPQRLRETAEEIRGMTDQPHMQGAYLGALRALVGSYIHRGRDGMWSQAARVRAPTLVIYGEADPFISTRMAARAVHYFHCGRVLMLSGIGHVAQLETPDVVAQAVRTLLPEPSA